MGLSEQTENHNFGSANLQISETFRFSFGDIIYER